MRNRNLWVQVGIKVCFIMRRSGFSMDLGGCHNKWNNIVSTKSLYMSWYWTHFSPVWTWRSKLGFLSDTKIQCLCLLLISFEGGRQKEYWKWARWLNIHIFQVNSLHYPKVYLPVFLSSLMLTVRISGCYRLVWNTLCINGQGSVI